MGRAQPRGPGNRGLARPAFFIDRPQKSGGSEDRFFAKLPDRPLRLGTGKTVLQAPGGRIFDEIGDDAAHPRPASRLPGHLRDEG